MKQEYMESAERVMTFIKKVETEIGPRLPASPEERKGAELIRAEYEKNIGLKTIDEPFKVAPKSSVGAMPYIGLATLVAFVLFYIYPLAGAIVAFLALFYAGVQCITYSNMFDFLWPKKESSNFYTVQEPKSGKADYTVIISAHYDSSWEWTLQYKNPKTFIPKIAWGTVGTLILVACGIVLTVIGKNQPIWTSISEGFGSVLQWVALLLPIPFLPGLYFLTQFLNHDKSVASPGAMDNLTGIGINMEVAKYYNEHPDMLPDNCRLICAGLGCEESGLKGSSAFVKKHKNEEFFKHLYVVNLDSISDYDYFEVVTGDPLQFANYPKDMVDIAYDSLQEAGVVRKTGKIVNPIGGNDATPFHKAGAKAITIAAQNPIPTDYYHTRKDRTDRLSEEVFAEGIEVTHGILRRIFEKEAKK